MSVQNQQAVWSVKDTIDSKYEKCRNITEEIYKRINITFQIKQLETAALSDVSDQRYVLPTISIQFGVILKYNQSLQCS